MPEWVNKVNEPTKADLKRLEDALLPHTDKYNQIYKPIRHEVFAHKKPMDDQDLAALFGKTRIEELGETLRFLYESTVALRELFQNGTALVFQNGEFRATTDYDGWTKTIRSSTRAVLTAL